MGGEAKKVQSKTFCISVMVFLLVMGPLTVVCNAGGMSSQEKGEGLLGEIMELLETIREMLRELALIVPRIVHNSNLRTINQAVDLYIMLEGEKPRGIGEEGQPGTLVGEGYLESGIEIPAGLRQEEGEWSEYFLEGDPPRGGPLTETNRDSQLN